MDTITTIMGYSVQSWADLYLLYAFENNKAPPDLWELRRYWLMNEPRTPDDCVRITAKLVEAREMDIDNRAAKMCERFLNGIQPHNVSSKLKDAS